MAKYKVAGISEVKVSDPTTTATLRNMTQYIDTVSALGKDLADLDVTSFADAAERFIAGIEQSQTFTINGFFEDTATTGPDIVFSPVNGSIGTVQFFPAGTVTGRRLFSMQAFVSSYKVTAAVKGRVEYVVVYKQDGSMTNTAAP